MSSYPTSCIVVQVRNSTEYIAAFLSHHLNLVDEIYLIDHNSDVDFRALKIDRVNVFRSKISTYALDLNINAVVYFEKLSEKFDWVFCLDIDEFLPFSNKPEFSIFLQNHSKHGCIKFHWKNGISIDYRNADFIQPSHNFLFHKKKSNTFKLVYNSRMAGKYFIKHGNHSAVFLYSWTNKLRRRQKKTNADVPIYHIPFLSVFKLREKLSGYPEKAFKRKILRHTQMLKEKYGEEWFSSQLEADDIFWLIANYRVNNPANLVEATRDTFEEHKLFEKSKEVYIFNKYVDGCPPGAQVAYGSWETELVNTLRKNPRMYQHVLRENIEINDLREITSTIYS